MDYRKIGVVGAGAMGAGIAQACVQRGLEAVLIDETEELLGWGEGLVLRGLHRAEQPSAFSLLRKSTDLRQLCDCDAAVETAGEGLEAKKALLRRIDAQLPPERILAVNTAVLPVALLASAAENPQRVVGIRFFPPPSITPLVEVMRHPQSTDKAFSDALSLAEALGKTAARCKDSPGFIVNRVARPFFLVSLRLLEQGRGGVADIDGALRAVAGLKLGPLELLDLLGLEEELSVSAAIYDLCARPERLRPCALLEKLLARGCRGRKNNRGFYVYGENPPGTVNPLMSELAGISGPRPAPAEEISRLVMEGVAAEARILVKEGIASAKDVDLAVRLGLGWSKGPLERIKA